MVSLLEAQILSGVPFSLRCVYHPACFPLWAVYEVSSESSLSDAISDVLEAHNLRCLPVRNAKDPHSPEWSRRYLGVIDHSGIMLWVFSEVRDSTTQQYGALVCLWSPHRPCSFSTSCVM